jgi:sulfate adenylyltransferase large subunit
MATAPLIGNTFDQFLQQEMKKDLLRFTTAGSVDDGKSTLIGRLLHDAKGVYEDQLASLKQSRVNRSNGLIDFSLLTDGLRAEREQGITIDVAYRYFATARRRFIIADTPGHEQYTRNMATGASTANLAVILVDATKGLLAQTKRHTYIASLLGIPTVVAAINKMDLVGYREDVYLRLRDDFLGLAAHLNISAAECIPVSATEGDNIVEVSGNMAWYTGPTLLEHLETVPVQDSSSIDSLRFPVQYVIRPDSKFRGFAGQVAGAAIQRGDTVVALPSGQTTRVRSIVTYEGNLETAEHGQSVALELEDEIDISRGDMLVSPDEAPVVSRSFGATIVWMNEKPLEIGRTYLAKHTSRQVKAQVTAIQNRININTLGQEPAHELEMNGIALVSLETSSPLFFDTYKRSRATGSFILVDPMSNATVAAGMIRQDLSEHANKLNGPGITPPQKRQGRVTSQERFERHGHRPAAFLVPAALVRVAERGLFDVGFEAIVLDVERISPALISAVLDPLWSAGFVVLFGAEGVQAEVRRAIETLAADSFVACSTVALHRSEKDLVLQVVARAESLRVAPSRSNGKGD